MAVICLVSRILLKNNGHPHSVKIVSIDCRMARMSGIGVYIQNIVPLCCSMLADVHFRLLGDTDLPTVVPLPNAISHEYVLDQSPIYSLREQWSIPYRVRGSHALWVPHYNIPLGCSVPMIVTVHDVAHLVLDDISYIKRMYAKTVFAAVRRKAQALITVSNFTKEEFLRRVGMPLHGEIVPIYNGVDTAWLTGCAPSQKPAKPYFVAVGNIKAHKNIQRLCAAFGSVSGCIPHNLVLIGKKEGFKTGNTNADMLEQYAPGRIEFWGAVKREKLQQCVQQATALVFPSLYEGFGLPPLEAMAIGAPALVADIPVLHEVCGNAGLYVDPYSTESIAQGLLSLADMDEAERERMTNLGRQQAQKFSWQSAAENTASVIQGVLGD